MKNTSSKVRNWLKKERKERGDRKMKFSTRHIILRPMEEKDLSILHQWRNDGDFIQYCSVRRYPVEYEEFINELQKDFKNDRHRQFIIELQKERKVIGTTYSYNFNSIDGYAFITIYLEERYRYRGYGAEAVALFLRFLFESYPLYKIYMEVYDYNQHALSILQNASFEEEGRFKEHRFFREERYDLIRFAFFQKSLTKVFEFLENIKFYRKGGDV
ncbi:GNAT family N-acetyltransferase [Candidatus Wolfebacteria bacterium]|nr:GNAT family N-acetyltransferase [Candidatus Wolfebacteria bacterium]